MIVLGIDPGTADTGFGVVESAGSRLRRLDSGVIQTRASSSAEQRLAHIHAAVSDLLDRHRPAALAIEELYFGVNVRTAFAVGQARGVVLLAAGQRTIPTRSYTPQQVKAAVCGHGRADKAQVTNMVTRLLALTAAPGSDHAADALAVAICDLNRAPLAEAVASQLAGAPGVIALISGTVAARRHDHVVVECAGVGYRLAVSAETLRHVPAVGHATSLHTHLVLRDDSLSLYGFSTEEERELFLMLLGVQAVGPKVALAVLSGGSPRELLAALAAGDAARFQAAPGVGKRTAERIIVELREKVGATAPPALISVSRDDDPRALAREGLIELGYSPQEADALLRGTSGERAEDLISEALRTARR